MNIIRLVSGALLLAVSWSVPAIAPYPPTDSHVFSPAQQAEIRRIVMEYLLSHPEVIQAAHPAPGETGCLPVSSLPMTVRQAGQP
ncbi:hypothetical protein [Dickeya lacustris]|uniref:Copper resistance protein ScsC N-terminal domain-containing protein n=1 Tax=Dickeya lacustris TaxID=2259638 RepID=A0ABY8G2W6_9GAMM|nr:hypothetical protein [Dickeya lacustris]WFN54288.1 hypothetical protein O1Q98_11340 [Dickeya lacustris]